MARKVLARIKVYKDGYSYQGARVTNSRNSEQKITNSNGEALFEFDEVGTVSIYVNGSCVFDDYLYKFADEYKNGLIFNL